MYNTNLLDCSKTEVAVDIGTQTTRFVVCSLSALATSLILSVSALAATDSVIPCEQVGRDLKSLNVPVNSLTVNAVDHVVIDPDASDPDAISTERLVNDLEAPVLFLTPRVTQILRDVFGVTTEEQAPDPTVRESSSPVADREEAIDSAISPTDVVNEVIDLPHYQRQMYRTDI